MMADDSRPKRILSDLSSALRRDPKIDEFDFIYCPEPVVNRSPVVLENHKLGLETWSMKLLFSYVYNSLLQRTGNVRDLKSIHEFSSAALLINPECYSIWNLRRWLLLQLFPSTFTTRHQCTHGDGHQQASNHRNSQNGSESNGNSAHFENSATTNEGFELTERHRQAVQYEMAACKAAADRYPSNYNAWSHRIWVVQRIGNLDSTILEEELASTRPWVQQHISDHSGFNYRQFLLNSLHTSSCSHRRVAALIKDELKFTSDLIQSFPGHEAIWYHRRFIIHLGKCHLRVKQEQSLSPTHSTSVNNTQDDDGVTNGLEHCQRLSAATHQDQRSLPQAEPSNHSSPPRPKTAKTEASIDAKSRVQNVTCPEEGSLESLIGSKSEVAFTEAVYKKTNKADRPLLKRCIEQHKRWLNLMQY